MGLNLLKGNIFNVRRLLINGQGFMGVNLEKNCADLEVRGGGPYTPWPSKIQTFEFI